MKKFFAVLFAVIFCLVTISYAEPDATTSETKEETTTENPKLYCPKTLISDNDSCMKCHVVPTFELKDADPHEKYDYPAYSTEFIFDENGNPEKGYYLFTTINSNLIKNVVDFFFAQHKLNHLIIEIQSPGGSMLEALRIVGIFKQWQNQGKIIETKCNGFAASAGLIVFDCW